MTPVQQYYFALKILQRVEPKEMEEVPTGEIDEMQDKTWSGEEKLVQLVLDRKKEMEEGKVTSLSLEKFAQEIQRRIEQHRS